MLLHFSDSLSVEKIAAAGEMITRIYIDCKMRYKTDYENPVMFPRAPQQTFVDAFTAADTTKKCLVQKDRQFQYEAEVDLYKELERLESKRKIIVLHNFSFSEEQARLYGGTNVSQGEHDFVVIVRNYAVILFEVKSPTQIKEKAFKRNLSDSKKQLERAHSLLSNICDTAGVKLADLRIFRFTVLPKTAKSDVIDLPYYQKLFVTKDNSVDGILFKEDVENFRVWWLENVMSCLVKHRIRSRKSVAKQMQQLEAILIGLWCVSQDNKCDIDICSLGYCINKVDKAIKSANITQNKNNPVTGSVKVSPLIFKEYLGVDCLTQEQKRIFQNDELCQFITGPAGSGKTLLLLGKIVKLFKSPAPVTNERKITDKFLFITATMDLDYLREFFKKVGMKAIFSHDFNRCTEVKKLIPSKNESFFEAFKCRRSDVDIFVLHQLSVQLGTCTWPKGFLFDSSSGEILLDVLRYSKDYHIFVDDLHTVWDQKLALQFGSWPFTNNPEVHKYDSNFSRGLVIDLVNEMNERLENKERLSCLWLVYDHNQLQWDPHYASVSDIQLANSFCQYVKDLNSAIDQQAESNTEIFQCLSKNLRNSVEVISAFESVRKYYHEYMCFHQSLPSGYVWDNAKMFEKPGHHIHGPKPEFIMIKNSGRQEELVYLTILDELEKLLVLGNYNLEPKDVAILLSSCTVMNEFGHGSHGGPPIPKKHCDGGKLLLPLKMDLKIKEMNFDEVQIFSAPEKDNAQSCEWKAVIYVVDLEETAGINLYNGKTPHFEGPITDIESYTSLFNATLFYVPFTRARVYLTVIGKVGGSHRSKVANLIAPDPSDLSVENEDFAVKFDVEQKYNEYHRIMRDIGSMIRDGRPMLKDDEYDYFKKKEFLYRVVDNNSELDKKLRADDIWFNPPMGLHPKVVLEPLSGLPQAQ